ncbi:hypothetical protein GBA52_023351 [Prunus armeniaca]|nr:hypothetical protein GBA52_023351 [Prunus armeniaca]
MFSLNDLKGQMPTTASTLFSAYASFATCMMLLRSMAKELIPEPFCTYLFSAINYLLTPFFSTKAADSKSKSDSEDRWKNAVAERKKLANQEATAQETKKIANQEATEQETKIIANQEATGQEMDNKVAEVPSTGTTHSDA